MASLKVFSTQTDPGTDLLNDYSLLAEVPSDISLNKDANQSNYDNFNFTNMQSALTAEMLPEPDSSVEVHSRMNELLEENNQLKEMLNKNNSMMEENLKKAKEKIYLLENENSALHKNIDDLERKEAEKNKSCNRCTTLKAGLDNMLGMDYLEKNEYLLMEWNYFRENLQGNLKYICNHLEDISRSKKTWEEKILFDCYILMLKFKLAFLEGNVENAQFASLRTDEETGFEVVRLKPHEDPVMVEELKKEIKEKDEELNSMIKENENLLEKLEEYESKIQECKAVLTSQNELLNNKLENVTSISQKYQESCKILEQQIKELKSKLEKDSTRKSDDQYVQQLEGEIQNLKEMLKLEQQANKKNKEKISEIMNKCENLQVDYDRVSKILEIQSKDEKRNMALKEIDAKRYMEETDHLLAKLIDFQEQLAEKNAEIRRLQNQDEEQKSHSSRNQGSRFHHKNQNVEATGIILCPICNKGFTDENAAQNHAVRCLEESNQ